MTEADRAAPSETGGVLLGYWSAKGDAAVVEHVLGPGPKAKHGRTGFMPDHEYHDEQIARLYREASGEFEYLGDWHTHPGGPASLSATDLSTLKRIARHEAARAPRPLMLLLAGGRPWRPAAWKGEIRVRWHWYTELTVSAMDVVIDDRSAT